MVQLSTVFVVLAAGSAFATSLGDDSHLEERSLDAQTTLGGAPAEPLPLPFGNLNGPGAPPSGAPAPPSLKDGVKKVTAELKKSVKSKVVSKAHRIGTVVKQKAKTDLKLTSTSIEHVGDKLKLKLGSDLRKGIERLHKSMRKGHGRHPKLRKFRGRLGRISKHHDVDEFETEIVITIKQHSKHRGHGRKHHGHGRKHHGHGGRKHRGGRKYHGGRKHMLEHESSMGAKPLMHGEPMGAKPIMHEPASMLQQAHQVKLAEQKPMIVVMPMANHESPAMPSKMVKTVLPKSKVTTPASGDPSLGPFFGIESAPADKAAPVEGWANKEMMAEKSMTGSAPAPAAPHPKRMEW